MSKKQNTKTTVADTPDQGVKRARAPDTEPIPESATKKAPTRDPFYSAALRTGIDTRIEGIHITLDDATYKHIPDFRRNQILNLASQKARAIYKECIDDLVAEINK